MFPFLRRKEKTALNRYCSRTALNFKTAVPLWAFGKNFRSGGILPRSVGGLQPRRALSETVFAGLIPNKPIFFIKAKFSTTRRVCQAFAALKYIENRRKINTGSADVLCARPKKRQKRAASGKKTKNYRVRHNKTIAFFAVNGILIVWERALSPTRQEGAEIWKRTQKRNR